jgi:hypothetical protein
MPNTLRLFQYQDIVDTAGIPPTVQITSPANGTQAIYGSTLTVTAAATDDVAVAQVTLALNGQPALVTTAPPYEFTLTVPNSGSTLTLGAAATDFANNRGTAADVTLDLIPDPLTTVVGTVLADGQPVAGATVSCQGIVGTTIGDGTFTIPGVPTLQAVACIAQTVASGGVRLSGTSASVPPIRGGTTQAGSIAIGAVPIITSLSRKSALLNTVTTLNVKGSNLGGATFSFVTSAVTVTSASINGDGTVANVTLSVGTGAGTFAVVARNVFAGSPFSVTAANRFTVVDPRSIADSDGDGTPDAIEAVFGSDPLDPLSRPDLNAPQSGQIDATLVSVLNIASGQPGQLTNFEVHASPFSALNIADMTGGRTNDVNVTAHSFSVLNADPLAPPGAQTGSAGPGRTLTFEADATVFSVFNSATGTVKSAKAVETLSAAGDRAPATGARVVPLKSRSLSSVVSVSDLGAPQRPSTKSEDVDLLRRKQ